MTIDYKDARHSFQCLKLNIYGLCADDTGGTEEGEEHADKQNDQKWQKNRTHNEATLHELRDDVSPRANIIFNISKCSSTQSYFY